MGGEAAGTRVIVYIFEKWNVVITAVIKEEQDVLRCELVLPTGTAYLNYHLTPLKSLAFCAAKIAKRTLLCLKSIISNKKVMGVMGVV